jgi:large subunit ribosomal protein L3
MPAILGRKVGMTSLFDEQGRQVPATVLAAGPCQVLQIRSPETDGYAAVQLGFEDKPERLATRPEAGHAKKAGVAPKRFVREYRTSETGAYQVGGTVTVAAFEGVPLVDVTGVTKGRGFQGVMKRWGFGGQPGSHGTERKHRSPGGIGEGAGIPGRAVRKGKHMSGHMGHVQRTAERLKVLRVDAEGNLLVVRGSVPGPNGGYVFVRSAKKTPPPRKAVAAKPAKKGAPRRVSGAARKA